jgi:hypothetical protein
VVEVRSLGEILRTLGPDGTLDGLPFMPEMRAYCGRRFRVVRRAEKTCVEGCRMRRVPHAVFLEGLRCDGNAHADCQRRCLLFWKEAWLKPIAAAGAAPDAGDGRSAAMSDALPVRKDDRYFCQSTELAGASTPLPWWDARQYVRDLLLGEATPVELALQAWLLVFHRVQRLFGGGAVRGPGERGVSHTALHLVPGELVEIRPQSEIVATLNSDGKNRGLEFTPDMAQYCGRRYRVAGRVEKIILECTGQLRAIDETVILEGLACKGWHARGCPRANYHYWREAWLKRVEDPAVTGAGRHVGGGASAVPAGQCR